MMSHKIGVGDKVSVLDEAIDGIVIKVENNKITIKTSEGLMMTYFVNEIIKSNNFNELGGLFSFKSLSDIAHDKAEPKKRSFVKEKKNKKEDFVLEIDLHIEKLVKNSKRLSNFDMLNIQMETVKMQLEFAIQKRIPKMILIHGVGQGVLKSEIDFYLSRYDNVVFKEANFQKYGFGATEVYIKQNPNR